MSNCSTTSYDDIKKIWCSVFRSCPMAQCLGTPLEPWLFLFKSHPSKWQCVFNRTFNFCVANQIFFVWHSAMNDLPLPAAELGHSHCIPSSEEEVMEKRRENFADQWWKLKYIMILRKFASNLSIASTAITDIHLSSADLEANCLSPYSYAQS